MKDYVIVVKDNFEDTEEEIIIKNVNSLYADGFESGPFDYTNLVINEEIVFKLRYKFIEYMELEEYKEKYKEEKND